MSTAALQLQPHPRLQPTTPPAGPRRPAGPQLRVLDGGRAPASLARRAAYRRRRLVAVAALVALVLAASLLADAVLAGIAGGGAPSAAAGASSPTSAAASGAAGVAAADGAATRIVQPGDTLWTIAAAVAPDVDVRVTVERLTELNGGAALTVGQRLVLP